jgi:hypothetical protein
LRYDVAFKLEHKSVLSHFNIEINAAGQLSWSTELPTVLSQSLGFAATAEPAFVSNNT